MTNYKGEEDNRPFLSALLYERDGDLNLSQLFCLVMGLAGSIGFITIVVLSPILGWKVTVVDRVAAWSFMGAAFASVLIAAIPIAKAKILANSKLPGEIAKGIAASIGNVTDSSDIQELSTKKNTNESDDIG